MPGWDRQRLSASIQPPQAPQQRVLGKPPEKGPGPPALEGEEAALVRPVQDGVARVSARVPMRTRKWGRGRE